MSACQLVSRLWWLSLQEIVVTSWWGWKERQRKRKKNPLRHKSSKANVLQLIWSVVFSSSWLSSTSTYVHECPQLLTPEFKDLLSLRKSTIFHTATRGIKSSFTSIHKLSLLFKTEKTSRYEIKNCSDLQSNERL